jgi:hypothetical protein
MDKEQAEKALAIIREVIENTRDDLVAHNWGLIWMVHAFINLVGAASGTLIDRQQLPAYAYILPLLAMTVLNIVTVLLLVKRDQGVRSFVEWQLWAIWVAFLVFTLLAITVLHVTHVDPTLFGPVFAANCGFGFAMMGVVFYRGFFCVALLFVVATVLAAVWRDVQWWIIGVAWWFAMFVPGYIAFREQRMRQARDERPTKLL